MKPAFSTVCSVSAIVISLLTITLNGWMMWRHSNPPEPPYAGGPQTYPWKPNLIYDPPQEPAGISTHPEWTQGWWSDLTPDEKCAVNWACPDAPAAAKRMQENWTAATPLWPASCYRGGFGGDPLCPANLKCPAGEAPFSSRGEVFHCEPNGGYPLPKRHEGRTHVHKYLGCDPHCVFEDNTGRSMGECLEVLNSTSLKWPDRYCLRWMPRARR